MAAQQGTTSRYERDRHRGANQIQSPVRPLARQATGGFGSPRWRCTRPPRDTSAWRRRGGPAGGNSTRLRNTPGGPGRVAGLAEGSGPSGGAIARPAKAWRQVPHPAAVDQSGARKAKRRIALGVSARPAQGFGLSYMCGFAQAIRSLRDEMATGPAMAANSCVLTAVAYRA